MVQISGKMLIAKRRRIVGAMNSQAMARSERPRTRRASRAGVAAAVRVIMDGVVTVSFIAWFRPRLPGTRPLPRSLCGRGRRRMAPASLDLAVVLEHLLPVLDQRIERFLGGALVGDDVVVDALLLVEQELGIGRLSP